MGLTRFEVEIRPGEFTAHGADEIQFMISPNPGEPVKPLAAIASGGELSRIMLAFKAIAADEGGVPSMVFDEVDAGVSGHMAQAVGEKMAAIARRRQVICVTHLPQIAALAGAHYLVEKTVEDQRTGSTVRRLDRQGRVEELSRLIGGAGDPQSGRRHAAHMLDAAQALVKER
jgi:DNA repair protein RecN (Recombination protein N)